jgi:hypothetical protein
LDQGGGERERNHYSGAWTNGQSRQCKTPCHIFTRNKKKKSGVNQQKIGKHTEGENVTVTPATMVPTVDEIEFRVTLVAVVTVFVGIPICLFILSGKQFHLGMCVKSKGMFAKLPPEALNDHVYLGEDGKIALLGGIAAGRHNRSVEQS